MPRIAHLCHVHILTLRDYVALENMLNPPNISIGTNGSTCGDKDVTRYTIDLNALTISAQTFPNTLDDSVARYINKFDFPTINEAYRGKEVGQRFFIVRANNHHLIVLLLVLYHLWLECI